MLVQKPVVMWKFYDGRKRRKLKEVCRREETLTIFCDTYYEEEDDE